MFLGNALVEAGRPQEALAAYAAALALRPAHAPTLYNLGNALLGTDDPAAAEARFREALALAPTHAGSHNNLGNALRRLGRHAEAAETFRAALALRPGSYGTLNNLGSALLSLHRPDEALRVLDQSLRLNACYAEAHNNRGGALLALDRPEQAELSFRNAVALEPGHAQARLGLALALLTQGRLQDGFAAYETRWGDPRFCEDVRPYDAPLWLGETDISGRTILLHHEQGLGDTIQFARYAPLLRARGARVILEVQAPLLDLLRPLADAAVAAGADLPPHAFRTPLLSLPLAFGTDVSTIPAAVPYLRAARVRADLRGPGLNVALTFSGSPDHPEDILRSIPAAGLLPLLRLPGITWHIVQKDIRPEDATVLDGFPELRRHGPGLADFGETAALLAAMDLCISADTSVAHLAGALGLPVWICLQHAADFRWLRERPDSPWYPTALLFRQGADRTWPGVIGRVGQALRQRLGG